MTLPVRMITEIMHFNSIFIFIYIMVVAMAARSTCVSRSLQVMKNNIFRAV